MAEGTSCLFPSSALKWQLGTLLPPVRLFEKLQILMVLSPNTSEVNINELPKQAKQEPLFS